MGESAAETVKEIEETRDRLERRLDAIEARVPAATAARWGLRLALGSGLAGTVAWWVLRRARRPDPIARSQSPAPLAAPVPVSIEWIPDRWARVLETERGRATAAGLLVAWALLRLAEARLAGR